MALTLMALLCNLYITYCTSHCVPTVHCIDCKLIPINSKSIALHCKHQSYIYFQDIYNSLHVLMISDHSHTAVTELFCKVKQPLLSYFKLNLLTRDPGDDKVQLELLTEREHQTIQFVYLALHRKTSQANSIWKSSQIK